MALQPFLRPATVQYRRRKNYTLLIVSLRHPVHLLLFAADSIRMNAACWPKPADPNWQSLFLRMQITGHCLGCYLSCCSVCGSRCSWQALYRGGQPSSDGQDSYQRGRVKPNRRRGIVGWVGTHHPLDMLCLHRLDEMVREPSPAEEDCEHDCPDTIEDINLVPRLH